MTFEPSRLQWHTLALAGVLVAGLAALTWQAGRSSAQLDRQRLSQQVASLQHQIESTRYDRAQTAMSALQPATAPGELQTLRAQLLRSQAEANQYRSRLESEWKQLEGEKQVISALSVPGTRLYSLKSAEAGINGSAYVLVVPGSKLILIASQLPQVGNDREFQLWITPHGSGNPISAAIFPGDGGTAFRDIEDAALATDADSVEITIEPLGGSPAPTGPKLYIGENCSAK